jgi:hypothetical protein
MYVSRRDYLSVRQPIISNELMRTIKRTVIDLTILWKEAFKPET